MMAIPIILIGIATVIAPWWVTGPLAAWLAFYRGSIPALLIVGLLLDRWYGYPIEALGGFSFIYTAVFAALGLVSAIIRTRVID